MYMSCSHTALKYWTFVGQHPAPATMLVCKSGRSRITCASVCVCMCLYQEA
nr:MAG: MC010R [Molluscum contagiosum virus]